MIELDGTMPCYQLIITITIFRKESIVVSLEEGLLVVILKIIIILKIWRLVYWRLNLRNFEVSQGLYYGDCNQCCDWCIY